MKQTEPMTPEQIATAGPGQVIRVNPPQASVTSAAPGELTRATLSRIGGLLESIRSKKEVELRDLEAQMKLIHEQIHRKELELEVIEVRQTATRAAMRVLEDHGVS